jgi:hypothetical protein
MAHMDTLALERGCLVGRLLSMYGVMSKMNSTDYVLISEVNE